MPILGHAITGLLTSLCVNQPSSNRLNPQKFWLPSLLVLSYLPDIASQLLVFAGYPRAKLAGHSLIFALAGSGIIAHVLARIWGRSFQRTFILISFTIVLHDLLDLLQSANRLPLWPLSDLSVGVELIPRSMLLEAACLGGIALIILAIYRVVIQKNNGDPLKAAIPTFTGFSTTWPVRLGMVLVVSTAVLTHYLRDWSEQQLTASHSQLMNKNFAGALSTLHRLDHWPLMVDKARIDYYRAEAFLGLGDRQQAERFYLQSFGMDPGYFWCVADLALFYASSPKPLEIRRLETAPYYELLGKNFSGHPAQPRYLQKINIKLKRTVR